MNDEDLTPDERSAFASLPRERRPSDLLEERTVGALRAAGLLGARRRRDPRRAWPRAAAAAAVLALMAGSFALGQRVGTRGAAGEAQPPFNAGALAAMGDSARETGGGAASGPVAGSGAGPTAGPTAEPAAGPASGSLATAVDVQRAGSAYIAALARLTAAPAGADTAAALESREVAIATLLGAAQILARLDPRQPVARSLLAGLEPGMRAADDTTQASRRDIVWF